MFAHATSAGSDSALNPDPGGVRTGAPAAVPPRVILGTARLALRTTPRPRSTCGPQAFAYLDRAFEIGIRALDTAAIYQFGSSERAIGEWLRRTGNRDRIYLIGKGGHPSLLGPSLRGRSRLRRGDLEHDLQASLRRLRTDRLDLYLLHHDAPGAPLAPIAETLWSFVTSGRIRAYGVSNWTHERFTALHALAVSRGMPLPAASSPQFSLPQWVATAYPGCVSIGGPACAGALRAYRAAGAAVLAWSPLGDGWLRAPGRRARSRAYRGSANDARLSRLRALAGRIGCTPAQAALAYVLAHGSNVHAVVGTRRPDRLAELHAAAALTLSPEQIAWLADGKRPADGPRWATCAAASSE